MAAESLKYFSSTRLYHRSWISFSERALFFIGPSVAVVVSEADDDADAENRTRRLLRSASRGMAPVVFVFVVALNAVIVLVTDRHIFVCLYYIIVV